MASSTPHTIVLFRNTGGFLEDEIQEAQANEAITPGSLIEHIAATGKVQNHSTADGVTQKMVAVENPYDDDNTAAAIDSAYGTADSVRFIFGVPGDRLYMRYSGTGDLTIDDPLVSAGDGTLKEIVVTAATLAGAVVGFADEAVTGTGSAQRAAVRIA